MPPLGRAVLIGAIVAAHAGGFWWLLRAQDAPEPLDVRPARHVPEREHVPARIEDAPVQRTPLHRPLAAVAEAPPPSPAMDSQPLPPRDTPLVDVLGELQSRAQRGDERAACRLALDSALCQQHPALRDSLVFAEDIAARHGELGDQAIDHMVRLEGIAEHGDATCAGLDPGWADKNAWRHMLASAQIDARVATRFAALPPLSGDLADLQPDAWNAYRNAASGLLLRAAQEGDPRAIYYLQRVYSGQPLTHEVADPIAPDPHLALVYALVLQRFSDAGTRNSLQEQIDAGRTVFEPQEWLAIETQAAELVAQHFATQAPIDFSAGVFDGQDSQICDAPPAPRE